jgi:hypothetical protein
MRRARRPSLALTTVAVALLLVAPMSLYNPDFARTPLEWIELLLGAVLITGAPALLALLWTRRRDDDRTLVAWGLWLGCTLVAATTAAIVAGWPGLAATAFAFCALAVFWRLHSPPDADRSPQVLLPALGVAMLLGTVALVGDSAPQRQVIFIGLDGADWPIIDRLRDQGRLPTFDRLIQTGARADLETLHPIFSPPIWTSIATGVMPATHGVKDFWVTARDVRVKRFWEVADESGMTSGVMSYLVTWPPDKSKGFQVPGLAGAGRPDFPE